MEYNTQRNQLEMPEYGRHIQKMIEFACTIEDQETRNQTAQSIVNVMGTLNPHLRDIADFKHKLWDHLFIISNFKLDVDSPFPKLSADHIDVKPRPINYPSNKIKYKYYGKVIQDIIKEVSKVEDGASKDALVKDVANFMKMQYLQWNRDAVENSLIFQQLRELSDDKIEIKDSLKLNETFEMRPKEETLKKKNKRMIALRNNGNQQNRSGSNNKKRKK